MIFPKAVERVVVANGNTATGVAVASVLLQNEDVVPRQTPIVLTRGLDDQLMTPADEANVFANLQVPAGVPRERVSVAAREFVAAPSDAIVYLCEDRFELKVVENAIRGLAPTVNPKLVIIATSKAIASVLAALNNIQNWKVVLIRVPHISAAALTPEEPVYHETLPGPLENICLGVALGVTRLLRVNASQAIDVVPLDTAVNLAMVSFSLWNLKRIRSTLKKPNLVDISVLGNSENAVVWGMIGEYAVDYYGRYHNQISAAMPAGLFEGDPTLAFKVHLPDMWNYGLSLMAPIDMYNNSRSNRTKAHLRRFPHATTMERMKNALQEIDSTTEILSKPSPAVSMDGTMYWSVCRLLSADRQLVRLLPKVSLAHVQWERYVKRVSVAVLRFAARHILNHHENLQLPVPTPHYHNDFVFSGPDRAPEPIYNLRRWFPSIHWTLRAGQQPNGQLIKLVPGGTHQRRVAIIAQPHVQLLISKLSREQNVQKQDVEQRAEQILRGIGDNINHRQMRSLAIIVRGVFRQLYERVNVNKEAFDILHKIHNRPRTPVVMIPSHRSYIDFMILTYLLLIYGCSPPHICSGEDFLRLGPISEMLRGSGAFFMRRSFRGDKLYAALFKEYVRHLTRDGESIEFFIEGKRSRTGKTLPPKMGILKMCTDAFFEKQEEIDDVLILPVSLSYERLLEGNVYADELMGIPKPKETIGNLLKSASILRTKYGSLNIEVGEPISVREFSEDPRGIPAPYTQFAAAGGGAAPGKVVPNPLRSNTSGMGDGGGYTPAPLLLSLGWRITYDLQKRITVTPTALLSAVLLSFHDDAQLKAGVPLAVIASSVEWLRAAVLHRGGLMNAHLARHTGSELVTYAIKLLSPRLWVSPLSHVFINEELIVTTKVLLNIYANQLMHVFGDEGLMCAAALACGAERQLIGVPAAAPTSAERNSGSGTEGQTVAPVSAGAVAGHGGPDADGKTAPAESDRILSQGTLRKECDFLRKLLNIELPNHQPTSPIPLEAWFQHTMRQVADDSTLRQLPLSDDNEEELRFQRSQFALFSAHLLFPLIESYYVMACVLMALAGSNVPRENEGNLLRLGHEGALALAKTKVIDFVHSSNKENLQNALVKFTELGVVLVERQPSPAFTVKPALRKDRGAGVKEFVENVNRFRCNPSSPEAMESTVETLREMYRKIKQSSRL